MSATLTGSKGRNCFSHSHENIDNTEWLFRFFIKHNRGPWIQGVSLAGKIFRLGYLKKHERKRINTAHREALEML